MYCKNCGNEVLEGEKFCGKCGTKINPNAEKRKNNIKEKKSIKIKPIYLIIGIIAIIFIISIVIMNSNSKSIEIGEAKNTSSINTLSDQKTKKYYDFIDTDYYTFNFDENTIINRITGGRSYTEYGYTREKATSGNAYNYTAVSSNGMEVIHIEVNPNNNKVSDVKLMVTTKGTESQINTYLYNLVCLLIAQITDISVNTENADDIAKVNSIINDVTKEKSVEKGLKITTNIEEFGDIVGTSVTVEAEVVK